MNQPNIKVYEVEIEETVRYTYTVRASNPGQAERFAKHDHRDCGAVRAGALTEVTEQTVTHINEVA